jgi:hypothetical protein
VGALRWIVAALLLVGLILGVGLVFTFFLTDDASGATLAWGLALTGLSGGSLLYIDPGEEAKARGRQNAIEVLVAYALLGVAWAAWSLVGLWALLPALVVGLVAIYLLRFFPIVCPQCGGRDTFGPDGEADVCSNCGFDFRRNGY